MKIDRLIGILSILLREEKTTLLNSQKDLRVSRRTINQDIEDLCKAGIPIKLRRVPAVVLVLWMDIVWTGRF